MADSCTRQDFVRFTSFGLGAETATLFFGDKGMSFRRFRSTPRPHSGRFELFAGSVEAPQVKPFRISGSVRLVLDVERPAGTA